MKLAGEIILASIILAVIAACMTSIAYFSLRENKQAWTVNCCTMDQCFSGKMTQVKIPDDATCGYAPDMESYMCFSNKCILTRGR